MKVDGERMRRARISAGLSLRGLARAAGVSHDTVMLIESGRRSPHPATVAKLATAMAVPVEAIVDWESVEDDAKKAAA